MIIDLSTPEGKAALQEQIDEAVSGLKAKNSELLGEVKKLRKTSEIDPADVQALRDELDTANSKFQELSKLTKQLQGDAQKFKEQAEAESGYTSKLLIENGLNDALAKAGVKAEFLKAAKSMIGSQVQLKQDGETRMPVVGDKGLTDFVAEWSKSDEGKHFVAAPLNNGGGAFGGNGGKAQVKGDLGGDRKDRVAALAARFPELNT